MNISMSNVPQARSAILVNECQRGNPVLRHMRTAPYEFAGDRLLVDYEVGRGTGVLFLSLRYHKLHSNYIYDRLRALGRAYSLRVLLLYVDGPDHVRAIRELTRASVVLEFCVLLAWSNEEAARYIETFKAYELRSADALRTRTGERPYDKLAHALTRIRPLNKTDVSTLATVFTTPTEILCATPEDLQQCPGFGDLKIARFLSCLSAPLDPNL